MFFVYGEGGVVIAEFSSCEDAELFVGLMADEGYRIEEAR